MRTNKAAFARMERVSAILAKRYTGQSLAEIAAAESPPCTVQNISSLIQRALGQMPQQGVAEIRALEAGRLDAMQHALWPPALAGDIAAVDRVLQIMTRRARLLGLDLQRPTFTYGREDGETEQVVRVEIVGNPEIERVRWLESERERLLALTGDAPPPTTGTLN